MLPELFFSSPLSLLGTLLAVWLLHALTRWEGSYSSVSAFLQPQRYRWWRSMMAVMPGQSRALCHYCGDPASLRCSRCKAARYCSPTCQAGHWRSGHKTECRKDQPPREDLSQRRRSLERKNSEPYPAAEAVLYPYLDFVHHFQHAAASDADQQRVPVGLLNVGNTCYASAVLQCLAATAPFVALMSDSCGNHNSETSSSWSLVGEIAELMSEMSNSSTAVSPRPLLRRVGQIGRHLTFGQQEDSHDFFLALLDAIETELLQHVGGKDAVPDIRTRETTFIFHTFGGYMRNQVTPPCHHRRRSSSDVHLLTPMLLIISVPKLRACPAVGRR